MRAARFARNRRYLVIALCFDRIIEPFDTNLHHVLQQVMQTETRNKSANMLWQVIAGRTYGKQLRAATSANARRSLVVVFCSERSIEHVKHDLHHVRQQVMQTEYKLNNMLIRDGRSSRAVHTEMCRQNTRNQPANSLWQFMAGRTHRNKLRSATSATTRRYSVVELCQGTNSKTYQIQPNISTPASLQATYKKQPCP
jgi:hypothetical protein